MKVLFYPDPSCFPEDFIFLKKPDLVPLKKDQVQTFEEGELKDFLLAILSFNFLLVAHLFIKKNDECFGGEKIFLFFSTEIQNGKHLMILGTELAFVAQGGIRFKEIHLDVDLSKVSENHKNEYIKNKKDFSGWVLYFEDIFKVIEVYNFTKCSEAQAVLDALAPHRRSMSSDSFGIYTKLRHVMRLNDSLDYQKA